MDWILSVVSCIQLWLTGNKSKWGQAMGIAIQGLWVVYALRIRQPGLILGCVVYTVIYVRNTAKWWREDKLR